MNIIIFDYEVFTHDCLLGTLTINDDGSITIKQMWDLEEQRVFFEYHKDDLWVGHNNKHFDNIILENVVRGRNEEQIKAVSSDIVESGRKLRCGLKFKYYDLMANTYYSLKLTEAAVGKDIHESGVDFRLTRKLTEQEKKLTEDYNKSDLQQTYENFVDDYNYGYFDCRLNILTEFNLPFEYLTATETQVAAKVLKAHKIPNIDKMIIKPTLYPNLELKNHTLIDFYLSEEFRRYKKHKIVLCGTEHVIGSGGIHAAIPKYHCSHALYCDVSGYYNLTMLNYDLLPRTMSSESKKLYRDLYYKQLEYKKTAPRKRWALKVILLAVFGSMMNEYTDFYDPQKGLLVTITGQLFIVDLLEKLEGLVRVIQSNTDGIIIEPFDWNDKDKIISIIEAWEKRTGYVIKKDEIFDIHQRDVNCYFYKDINGDIHCKGEAVKDYGKSQSIFASNVFESKEPPIFAHCIVEYFVNHKLPEQVIEENKTNLRMFQYLCKKKSFDWTEYVETFKDGTTKTTILQGINRAFAYNNKDVVGMIYKRKYSGKVLKAKIPNCPDNVFVYDKSILDTSVRDELMKKIDYDYYVKRGYERIKEFANLIGDIKIYE